VSIRRLCIFCGGHGAATLVRQLARRTDIHTTLLINGYDNGLSTGLLRSVVPGMLGPSDFRKNLTYHLDANDLEDQALLNFMDLRLPRGTTLEDLKVIADQAVSGGSNWIRWGELSEELAAVAAEAISVMADHLHCAAPDIDLSDCALPNLIIAGLYLTHGGFNRAIQVLADQVKTPINVLNITSGENAFLIARKKDGTLLLDEADIVAPQSSSPIVDIHLLNDDAHLPKQIARMSKEEQDQWLSDHAVIPTLDSRATEALNQADTIVLAAGTQFSSLIPSYLTPGVAEAMVANQSRTRCLIVNLEPDNDIRGLDAESIVDNALAALGDPENRQKTLTHVLITPTGSIQPRQRKWEQHRGAVVVSADLADHDCPSRHNGFATLEVILGLDPHKHVTDVQGLPDLGEPTCWMFDLDGTLVDSSPAHEAAFRTAIAECYPQLDPDHFHYADVLGQSTRAITDFLGVNPEVAEQFALTKQAVYRQMIVDEMVHPLPGAIELLTGLRGLGHTIMVVSGGSAASTMAVLRVTGLLSLVDHVVPGDVVTNSKPAPDVYLRAVELADNRLRHIAVEDSLIGVTASRAARLQTIQVGAPLGMEDVHWVPDLPTLASQLGLVVTQ